MLRFNTCFVILVFLIPFSLRAWDRTLIDSIRQDTLDIAVYDSPPFGVSHDDGAVSGLMVELWDEIAGDLELNYRYIVTDMEDLLEGLTNGNYDVGIGAITITPAREIMVDFSQAVNASGTGIAVSTAHSENTFLSVWRPLLGSLLELLGSLLLVLMLSGSLIWIIERRKNNLHFHPGFSGLGDGLWWAAVTMSSVGYGDKVPRSQLGRLIGVVWMFTSIILISLFTARASSIFNHARVESAISTDHDLRRSDVGAAVFSSGEEYLKRQNIPYTTYDDINQALDAMIEGEIDAVVSNVPVLQHLKHSQYHSQMIISEKLLLRNNMGMAFPDQSPLLEAVDEILLQKLSEANWEKLLEKYLGPDHL